jgi:hypothetical protein
VIRQSPRAPLAITAACAAGSAVLCGPKLWHRGTAANRSGTTRTRPGSGTHTGPQVRKTRNPAAIPAQRASQRSSSQPNGRRGISGGPRVGYQRISADFHSNLTQFQPPTSPRAITMIWIESTVSANMPDRITAHIPPVGWHPKARSCQRCGALCRKRPLTTRPVPNLSWQRKQIKNDTGAVGAASRLSRPARRRTG